MTTGEKISQALYRFYQRNDDYGARHMPTQDEIAIECEYIRSTWSEVERESRIASAYRSPPVELISAKSHHAGTREVYDY